MLFRSDKLVLIGSNEPITLNWDLINQRATTAFSRQHYGKSGIAIQTLLARYRPNLTVLPPLEKASTEINTDLFPKDEYTLRGRDKISF